MKTENLVESPAQVSEITEHVHNSQRLTNLHLDILNKHKLGWSVETEDLVSKSGKPTDKVGLFRSDNGFCLGTHSKRYIPCQNSELVKLIVYACEPISDLNLDYTNGGVLQDGKKIFLQIPLPDTTIGKAHVKRMITALNSHDGKTAVALGTTQTVVSCQNTFFKAYKSSDMSRVGHYSTMQKKLESLTDNLRYTILKDQEQVDFFRKLQDTQVSKQDVDTVKSLVFNIPIDPTEISTRKENLVKKFDTCIDAEFGTYGSTAWGLFNAVTRYTNHHIRDYKSSQAKLSNVMIGTGAKINSTVYSYLLNNYSNN
jgi:phage/plasmid-like protein (TIGR03299 family)